MTDRTFRESGEQWVATTEFPYEVLDGFSHEEPAQCSLQSTPTATVAASKKDCDR